jgi:hypothetical protein
MPKFIAEIETRVSGITCLIGVIEYTAIPGDSHADSDLDFYGYVESSWQLLDRRGRPAAWLERKLNDIIRRDVDETVNKYMQ